MGQEFPQAHLSYARASAVLPGVRRSALWRDAECRRCLGSDVVVVCIGACLPQPLPVPGSLAPGMRQANDFLMALQLTGAAKHSSLANLQVRLPAVVICGGVQGVATRT